MRKNIIGVTLATAAALAFISAPVTSAFAAGNDKQPLNNINSSKGSITLAKNSCNTCKTHKKHEKHAKYKKHHHHHKHEHKNTEG